MECRSITARADLPWSRHACAPPPFFPESAALTSVLSAPGSRLHFSAKSTNFAGASCASTGQQSHTMKTSKNSTQLTFLTPMFGPEDSPAKTSRWREWAKERGLEGNALDSFMILLASLERHAPELYCSKTLQVSLAHTADEISPPSSGRWQTSGILSAGVCLTAKTLESPNHGSESTLLGVIEMSTVQGKYFLRPNAAKGMLRRANLMGRPLFPPLRQSLEILSAMDQSSNRSPIASTPAPHATREPIGAEPTSNIRNGAKSAASRQKNAKA